MMAGRSWFGRALGLTVAVAVAGFGSGTAIAQGAGDPNSGALTFTGGLDVPSVFVFRGIVQERDPKLTLWPYGDIGLALYAGDGGVKSVSVNFGVWNSLQTGSAGLEGPSRRLHYWEDFYTGLSLGLGGGVSVQGGFAVHTSPNAIFTTIKEISFKASRAGMLEPYGMVAFELTEEGQADLGSRKGSYLELGVGPRWTIAGGNALVAVPVKLGVSLSNYYEGADGDERFGFFDIGGLVTIPLTSVSSRFGAWNVHGGADVLVFGDTTKALNAGEKTEVVALFGIGVSY
jgi:hypothetical protein